VYVRNLKLLVGQPTAELSRFAPIKTELHTIRTILHQIGSHFTVTFASFSMGCDRHAAGLSDAGYVI
jgi:hypothetical protein